MVAADWAEGMGASLRAGLLALADSTDGFVLVSLVDLPDLVPEVVARVGSAARSPHVLARAAYDGVPGHPVLFGRDHWPGVAGDRARATVAPATTSPAGRSSWSSAATWPPATTSTPATEASNAQPTRAEVAWTTCRTHSEVTSAADVVGLLGRTGYLADDELATVTFLMLRMQRPLLLEGEPGTGKTALAEALAESLDLPLVRLQCYEGIDATQALYDWDFPRQILHLRALEAARRGADPEEAEKSLYDERFLLARPVLAALQQSPALLLVDEVDRADDEFEAFLLEVLSTWQVSIPELGTVGPRPRRSSSSPPTAPASSTTRSSAGASTTGSTTPVSTASCRSCAPAPPRCPRRWPAQVVLVVQQLRGAGDLQKPPGVAETIDWARALHHLGTAELDLESAATTLGALVKYREDADRVKHALDQLLRT